MRPPIVTFAESLYNRYGYKGWSLLIELGSRALPMDELYSTCESFLAPQFISDLEAVAERRGRIWYSDPEPQIARSSLDRGTSGAVDTLEIPKRRFVCELPDCHLLGPGAVGLLDGRKPILESGPGNRSYFVRRLYHLLGAQVLKLPVRRIRRTAPTVSTHLSSQLFPLVPFYNSYYYPWLIEYLPKLRMLELYEEQTGREPTILLPRDSPSFVTESLSLLGYQRNRWTEWHPSEQQIETLVLTPHRLTTEQARRLYEYDFSYNDVLWVRQRIRSAVGASGSKWADRRKIYVSRQQADRGRKVLNYDEVMKTLRPRGFEFVVFESLPFIEQIRLIVDADIIVGPHGAGLTNVIFADDPSIIELFPKGGRVDSFALLADLLGFDHNEIIGEAEGKNLIVDTETLAEVVDRIESQMP